VYIPKHFEVVDDNEVYAFIEQNAFGQLVSMVEGRLFTTHLPFLLSEDRTQVTGHLALQNPQHIELDGQDVLVTLTGAHDYISPAWYSSPGVPTWNYQAVHLYGKCRLFRDVDKLKGLVDTLTNTYEKAFAQPWQPDFSDSMLGAIVGVEILIDEIQCKYKLSQNRSSHDRAQVIERLRSIGSIKLSEAMARNEL
jgi:transcriptional regulator